MDQTLEPIYQAVLNGDKDAATENVQAALDAGTDAGVILQEGLIPAMGEVGRLFEAGDYYVPEMLIAARAMQAGLAILKPLLVDSDIKPTGKVAIGTVKGDLHDIGKNLVMMMIEGAGFNVIDLGVDVPPEKYVQVANDGAQIIGMSALLTTTMPAMKKTIEALEDAGIRSSIKIMVGGAPLTKSFADEIGADGYAPDAASASELAAELIASL